jgi:hypothetical protein
VTSRSPAHRGRGRGARSAAAEATRTRFGGVLALQRMAGNRAVRALISRDPKVVKIGAEEVRVASDAEKAEAERIIKDVKSRFGVTFDSMAAKKATLERYADSAPEDRRKALAVRPWELDELKAIQRALSHFAPVLGDERKKTLPKAGPQEFVKVGKLNTSPDDDPKMLGDRTRGEFFRDAQAFSVFEPGPDPPAESDPVERVATHEIAHGIFDPHLDAFMKATGYWSAEKVKRKEKDRVEGPPDGYADRNAKEDLAQSVMYFFVDPKRLRDGDGRGRAKGTWGNPCPKRFDFIKNIVAGWTPKEKR